MLPSCGPRKCVTVSIPFTFQGRVRGGRFLPQNSSTSPGGHITHPRRLLWGWQCSRKIGASVASVFPYKRVPARYNPLEVSLWAAICPAHSPPSSEYFRVEQFGKAPLGRGGALHVKTWLQNVSEAGLLSTPLKGLP